MSTITDTTVANLRETMRTVADELYRTGGVELSLTGELFLDNTADRVWFKVWNDEAGTEHWVAQVPEQAAFGETLVAVDSTSDALMY